MKLSPKHSLVIFLLIFSKEIFSQTQDVKFTLIAFTTKPTGQGTGLGFSLSYDIIKAHGGELRVETKEGEGAEFIIQLPA